MLGRLASGAIRIARQSGARAASSVAAAGARPRWGRLLAAALAGAGLFKAGNAIWPLLDDSNDKSFGEEAEESHVSVKVPAVSQPSSADGSLSAPQLSKLWMVSEAADRLLRDVATAVLMVFEYSSARPETQEEWEAAHTRAARRLLRLAKCNRGIYIKLGQHVAQLEWLLPAPYVREMAPMMREAPQSPYAEVRRIVAEELHKPVEAAFLEFERQPIASASLAQVHRARLPDGRRVAVKVQHAGLRETSQVDIATIELLVKTVKYFFPKVDYMWLVNEIKLNLPLELDFCHEARNAKRFQDNFEGWEQVRAPEVHHSMTTGRLLVMEFVDGVFIDDVEGIRRSGLDPAEVAKLLSSCFSTMMFRHGFVHCDPHSGNALVRPLLDAAGRPTARAELVLLDHGLYRELTDDFRVAYCNLWRSIIFADEEGIQKWATYMNTGRLYRLFAAVLTTKDWEDIMNPDMDSLRLDLSAASKTRTSLHAKEWADEIQDILRQVPHEMLLLLKTNDCLRAVDIALGSPNNTFGQMVHDCIEGVNEVRMQSEPTWGNWLQCWKDRMGGWLVTSGASWLAWWVAFSRPSAQALERSQASMTEAERRDLEDRTERVCKQIQDAVAQDA